MHLLIIFLKLFILHNYIFYKINSHIKQPYSLSQQLKFIIIFSKFTKGFVFVFKRLTFHLQTKCEYIEELQNGIIIFGFFCVIVIV